MKNLLYVAYQAHTSSSTGGPCSVISWARPNILADNC